MNRTNLTPRFRSDQGVTLVELVVVIAVAGILAAVSAPTVFGAIRRERQLEVVNGVANMYREARNQAMARGEAIIVASNWDLNGTGPGVVMTRATTMRLPDGGFELGSSTCDSDTEDISTDQCAEGSLCMNDRCWGRPARSCRELVSGAYTWREVKRYDVAEHESAGVGIRLAYASNTSSTICFDPDGRAEAVGGGVPIPWGGNVCAGEGFLVRIGRRDNVTWSDFYNKTGCNSTAADYESVGGYIIRVGYNGEIALRSPK